MTISTAATARRGVDLQPPTRVRYRVLALVCGLSMITYLDRVCFGAAAPAIAADLNLANVAELKWAFTAFAIAYAIFEVPTGWWGDRIGPRGMLIRIVIWWSVCTALTGIVGWKWGSVTFGGLGTLIALRFLFGAGEAGAYPNITRALYNWFPRAQWETAQGMVWMTGRLTGGLTPLIWAILVSGTAITPALMNWRGAFLFFGAIGLVWCLAFALLFRNRPQDHPRVNQAERDEIDSHELQARTGEHASVPWRRLLTNRSLWALCVMYSLVNYGWAFNITYLPSFLEQRFGIAGDNLWGAIYKGAPLWVGAIGCLAGGSVVSYFSRWLGSRERGRQALGVTALVLCALCWLVARQADNVHLFCISVAMAAFFIDLTLGATWATCQDLGRQHTAVVAGCMNTIGTLGAALAGWLTGTLVQRSLTQQAAVQHVELSELPFQLQHTALIDGYRFVFLTYMTVYFVAAGCWLLIDSRKPISS